MTTTPRGVIPQGFAMPAVADIIDEDNTQLAQRFGVAVDTSQASVLGNVFGIKAKTDRRLWEQCQLVLDQRDPNSAQGVFLDIICSYSGTVRKTATKSQTRLLLVGMATTSIPTGSRTSNLSSDIFFTTKAGAVLAAVTAWAAASPINLLDVRAVGAHVYVAIASGVTGSVAPTGTVGYPTRITDGSVTWVYVGDGTGFAYVDAEALVTGAITAPAFSLSRIATPVTGWASVVNPQDVLAGQADEDDTRLRLRRFIELGKIGSGTIRAIRGSLSATRGVTAVTVFENATDYPLNPPGVTGTGNEISPHAIMALVSGSASDADIAAAIFAKKPAGIDTVGDHSHVIVDEQGIANTIRWMVPTSTPIYVEATLEVDPSQFPTGGALTAAAYVELFGDMLQSGYDVVPSAVGGSLFVAQNRGDLPGLLGVSVKADIAPITGGTPANVTVPISALAEAAFDSTRINIVLVQRAP